MAHEKGDRLNYAQKNIDSLGKPQVKRKHLNPHSQLYLIDARSQKARAEIIQADFLKFKTSEYTL